MAPFIPLTILLFVLAILLRVELYFTVVWFLVGLYALSRTWTQRARRHLEVRRRFEDHAFIGDAVSVDLSLRNTSRLPVPWLEITESVPLDLREGPFPAQVISLGGHEERHINYTLQCRRRGYYQLGPLRMETGDVLGIDQVVVVAEEPRRMTVYPPIVPLHRLGLPTRSALVTLPSRMPLFEDPTRIMGVREYQGGDSPRRIHWSASARVGSLVVKQYQPAIARETLLCLDLDFRNYDVGGRFEVIELAIVAAASLASHMINQERLPVGLSTEGLDPLDGMQRRVSLPPGSERGHLMAVLEILARMQAAPGGNFAESLRRESPSMAWGSTLLAITGSIGEELAETMLYLKRRGHAVAVILVQPRQRRVDTHAEVAVPGLPIHRVTRVSDLAVVS